MWQVAPSPATFDAAARPRPGRNRCAISTTCWRLPEVSPFFQSAVARARPVVGDAGLERQRQRLGVHVRHHQQRAVAGIGDDGGDQAVGVEARRERRAFFQRVLVGRSGRKFGRSWRSSAYRTDWPAVSRRGRAPCVTKRTCSSGRVLEGAGEGRGQRGRALLADAAHRHAHVLGLDHHGDAARVAARPG